MRALNFKKTFFSNLNNDEGSESIGVKILGGIKNIGKKKSEEKSTVQIVVVDGSNNYPEIANLDKDDIVTVIYDRESLDSLFGLAFFDYLYDGHVKAIPYNHTFKDEEIKLSKLTILSGLEINKCDLKFLNDKTKSISIYGHRGSFDYLYDIKEQKEFKNITLYQSDNDFYIGGKNISKLENSVAMMLKILYNNCSSWNSWPLNKLAMAVGHHASSYENIPDYNLTKSTFTVNNYIDDKGREVTKGTVSNFKDVLMHDLKTKILASIQNPLLPMCQIKPHFNIDEYNVYRENIQLHIDKTRKLQGWYSKKYNHDTRVFAFCIPAISFAINDILTLSNNNVKTTVCVEDTVEETIYHILSRVPGTAHAIADAIKGDSRWMKGNVICVSKKKTIGERY